MRSRGDEENSNSKWEEKITTLPDGKALRKEKRGERIRNKKVVRKERISKRRRRV